MTNHVIFFFINIIRHIHKIAKSDYYFHLVRPPVSLRAWNNSASTGQILIKFDVTVFSKILSRKFKIN
jgi:hypothetical protein